MNDKSDDSSIMRTVSVQEQESENEVFQWCYS